MWLFVLFLAVPLIEIALFVQIGGAIGLWPTLATVVITAIVGTNLMRAQGRMAMADLRQSFGQLNDPTESLAHGAMILFSGALLLTPGFFTDFIGFALLVPAFRRLVFTWVRARVNVQSFSMGSTGMGSGQGGFDPRKERGSSFDQSDIIDGEYDDVTKPKTRGEIKGPSGWTEN